MRCRSRARDTLCSAFHKPQLDRVNRNGALERAFISQRPNRSRRPLVKGLRMRNSDFLRAQAEKCIALSRATFDLTVAGRLRTMAAELRAQAAEEDDHEGISAQWAERDRAVRSKSRRN